MSLIAAALGVNSSMAKPDVDNNNSVYHKHVYGIMLSLIHIDRKRDIISKQVIRKGCILSMGSVSGIILQSLFNLWTTI